MLCTVARADDPDDPIDYTEIRFAGFGAADPARDRQVVKHYDEVFKAHRTYPARRKRAEELAAGTGPRTTSAATDPEEIQAMQDFLTRPPSNRAEEIKADIYRKRLAAAAQARAAADKVEAVNKPAESVKVELPVDPIENVTALLDTLPAGVTVADGAVSGDDSTEILGRFRMTTVYNETEENMLLRAKLMAAAAGGNVVVLDYVQSTRTVQGVCRGVYGVIIRQAGFDPKKVKMGKLPSQI